ncbi:MAG: response regulator [Deltaproteobacteria bacterium]|nr:response regulator [Deltaproteobacteria bacterium]
MSSRRILIVDDEASIRESLAEFLRDYHVNTETASDAEEALEMLAADDTFDLLLVDLRLPGMSGEQLILKAHQLKPELRFLIHTGSIDYRLSNALITLGLSSKQIIQKPLTDLSSLIDKIEELFKA